MTGDNHRGSWRRAVSNFVLSGVAARFAGAKHVAIKEPNGSIGAPLMMEAMPESAIVLLVRDPRDAAASSLVSHQKGGWLCEWAGEEANDPWGGVPDEDPDLFV